MLEDLREHMDGFPVKEPLARDHRVMERTEIRESAHRVLIEAHLAEGNWVEARSSFAMLRRMTLRELGVEPSPGLWRMIDLESGAPVSALR